MDLNDLLKTKEVTLSNGEVITVSQLPYKGFCEMRDAAQKDDTALAGAVTVWYGVPGIRENHTIDEIQLMMPVELVDEICDHIIEITGLTDQDELQGNSEAGQNAA